MAITLKRQIDDDEKQIILHRYGRKCFATGHTIPEGEPVHFDHIRAFALGGASELDNIAPMCEQHNRAKGTLPLDDFRTKLRLEEFFSRGDRLTLKDLLRFLLDKGDLESFGEPVHVEAENGSVSIESPSYKGEHPLRTCPQTGWKYFYGSVPIALINSDDDENHQFGLQPRFLIIDKVFELYRHFQSFPVLQPSIGRLSGSHLLLFDGQHKAAALLWHGRKELDCKIYLEPDVKLLNHTNIAAHDKFAQTRFYSSVMILKLGSQFGADFENYRKLEDGSIKSEAGFMAFLERTNPGLGRADRNKRFRSYLYNAILEDEANMVKPLVSTSNRSSSNQPLTVDMLSKSVLSCFLYTKPVDHDMASAVYKREHEFENNLRLLNALWELGLSNWNPKASR
ncbi:HNH endonuclease, partial [Candidatus Bathyarchaeota archaeon]|nr:HNH endonuclease [Candidatus Bathyarchaeota archaeon]